MEDNHEYKFCIRAVDTSGSKTSASNRQYITFNYPDVPDNLEFRLPSVQEDKYVQLTFSKTPTDAFAEYNIERSLEIDGEFEPIDKIERSNSAGYNYNDLSANIDDEIYYYRIDVMDSCLSDLFTSEPLQTMLVKAEAKDRQYNYVQWNDISNVDITVNSYRLFRIIDGELNPSDALTTIADPSSTAIIDDLFSYDDYTDFSKGEGEFGYFVIADISHNGNNYIVYSNTQEIGQFPELFIPNAFKPVSSFIQDEGYSLYIYNKWGEKVFETSDKNKGWDGSFNGSPAPQEVYAYYIKYKDSAGKVREKKGTVTLIR